MRSGGGGILPWLQEAGGARLNKGTRLLCCLCCEENTEHALFTYIYYEYLVIYSGNICSISIQPYPDGYSDRPQLLHTSHECHPIWDCRWINQNLDLRKIVDKKIYSYLQLTYLEQWKPSKTIPICSRLGNAYYVFFWTYLYYFEVYRTLLLSCGPLDPGIFASPQQLKLMPQISHLSPGSRGDTGTAGTWSYK